MWTDSSPRTTEPDDAEEVLDDVRRGVAGHGERSIDGVGETRNWP